MSGWRTDSSHGDGPGVTATYPAPVFDHLLRLTDRRGTFEHARLDEPLPEHGYCTDDVARVLVVATRDHGPDRARERSGRGRVALPERRAGARRRLPQPDGQPGDWVDEPTLEDAWGRCIWGLGTAAAHSNVAWTRQSAVMQFERAAQGEVRLAASDGVRGAGRRRTTRLRRRSTAGPAR